MPCSDFLFSSQSENLVWLVQRQVQNLENITITREKESNEWYRIKRSWAMLGTERFNDDEIYEHSHIVVTIQNVPKL